MLLKLALIQGIYYVLTGIWPLIDSVSFQMVTGLSSAPSCWWHGAAVASLRK